MRKIVLLLSAMCLAAVSVGCDDGNMVVLQCDDGPCEFPAEKPAPGEGKPCDDENSKTCNVNGFLYCEGGVLKYQACAPGQICSSGVCKDEGKPKCEFGGKCAGGDCVCPEGQTCEKGVCMSRCNENESCGICRCDAPLACDKETNICVKPICQDGQACPQACSCPEGKVCKNERCENESGGNNPPNNCGDECAEDECFEGKCIGENVEAKCKDYETILKLVDGKWREKKCDDRCAIDIYGKALCIKESACNDKMYGVRRCSSNKDGIRYCDGKGTWENGGDCDEESCLYEYNEMNYMNSVVCEKGEDPFIYFKCTDDVVYLCIKPFGIEICPKKVYDCAENNQKCDENSVICED